MGAADETADAGPRNPADTLRATVDLVAARPGPLQVGDFEIDDEGRLRPRADGSPLAFGFSYLGVDFIAHVQSTPQPRISLSAELGKLPFRAQAGGWRGIARRIVTDTEKLPCGRISLSDDQDMHLTADAPAPAPLTPVAVMSTLTALLLDFKPYLDLLHLAVIAQSVPASSD